MSSPMKSGAFGVLIGIVIALVAVYIYSSSTNGGSGGTTTTGDATTTDGGTATTGDSTTTTTTGGGATIAGGDTTPQEPIPPAPPLKPIEKKPVPVSAVDRVVPRILKAEFAMTGRGRDANWGIGKLANFQYTVFVEAQSEILSKETFPTGKIEVQEKRTFLRVYDSIVASDVDFVLALDTLPIEEFSKAIDVTGVLVSSLTGNPAAGACIIATKNNLNHQLQKADGKGLRALLGWLGVKPNADVESKLNELAGNQLTKAIGMMRSISGKCYLISYLQDESGRPMMVDFKNEDGSEITDEEEQMVLKRVNAFIDYHLVPDKQCNPGDNWTVFAEDMQELFDPFVEGKYTGKINVVRKSNAENGDWVIAMRPCTVNVIGEGGTTTGSLRIENGNAKMDPTNVSLNDIFVKGTAKMQKLTRHHLLFTAMIDGWCKFQGRAVTVPLDKK